jgi:striatin 1/3/4
MNSTSGFPTSQANSFSFLNSKPKTATHIRVQNQELPEQKEPLIPKAQLTNHFDGVRDAYFFQSIMVTVSEDCQLRLWDMQDDFHSVQPYLAIREHTGPIFAVSGYETHQHKLNSPYVLFSAGADGVVNVWSAPACEDVQQNGPTEPYQQCLTSWSAHQDAIWQLRVNTQEVPLPNRYPGLATFRRRRWFRQTVVHQQRDPEPP